MVSLLRSKQLWVMLVSSLLLLVAFFWVVLRSGPFAAVQVVVVQVEEQALKPALFGIGTVTARHTYALASTTIGRLAQVQVDVGDKVQAGDILAVLDMVELDAKIAAQEALIERSYTQWQEAQLRFNYSAKEAVRYIDLFAADMVSDEKNAAKQQELAVAQSQYQSAQSELLRTQAELKALERIRADRYLRAPIDGLVIARYVEQGATVLAGQTVFEVIDPSQLWLDVRFDQARSMLLATGQTAQIQLRSQAQQLHTGYVARLEWLADAITEERRVKINFQQQPIPAPSIGELAEVSVQLPQLPQSVVVSNAALISQQGQLGVWLLPAEARQPYFQPVQVGQSDLDGQVQILTGLQQGQEIVLYSSKPLTAQSRVQRVSQLGVRP